MITLHDGYHVFVVHCPNCGETLLFTDSDENIRIGDDMYLLCDCGAKISFEEWEELTPV